MDHQCRRPRRHRRFRFRRRVCSRIRPGPTGGPHQPDLHRHRLGRDRRHATRRRQLEPRSADHQRLSGFQDACRRCPERSRADLRRQRANRFRHDRARGVGRGDHLRRPCLGADQRRHLRRNRHRRRRQLGRFNQRHARRRPRRPDHRLPRHSRPVDDQLRWPCRHGRLRSRCRIRNRLGPGATGRWHQSDVYGTRICRHRGVAARRFQLESRAGNHQRFPGFQNARRRFLGRSRADLRRHRADSFRHDRSCRTRRRVHLRRPGLGADQCRHLCGDRNHRRGRLGGMDQRHAGRRSRRPSHRFSLHSRSIRHQRLGSLGFRGFRFARRICPGVRARGVRRFLPRDVLGHGGGRRRRHASGRRQLESRAARHQRLRNLGTLHPHGHDRPRSCRSAGRHLHQSARFGANQFDRRSRSGRRHPTGLHRLDHDRP